MASASNSPLSSPESVRSNDDASSKDSVHKPVVIRQVWAHNLVHEFSLIRKAARHNYRCVSMDTEFPGVIFRSPDGQPCRDPHDEYFFMKKNVDAMDVIQVGLTFANTAGDLPDFETDAKYIWEFNFREFQVEKDPHASDSVALLRRQGINFERNQKEGIEAKKFAELMIMSGFVYRHASPFKWITFHGGYDFAYLIKVLSGGSKLPTRLEDFQQLMKIYFGNQVYDVKYMMLFSNGLYGGLKRLAETLKVDGVGKSHQAGSDSLLTGRAFQKMVGLSLVNAHLERLAGGLYGLVVQKTKSA